MAATSSFNGVEAAVCSLKSAPRAGNESGGGMQIHLIGGTGSFASPASIMKL
jgi:hypothetical protein